MLVISIHGINIHSWFILVKDPGIQFYGGRLFRIIQDEADAVFNRLPPPVAFMPPPSSSPILMGGSSGGSAAHLMMSQTGMSRRL